jgi:hypothetical protein
MCRRLFKVSDSVEASRRSSGCQWSARSDEATPPAVVVPTLDGRLRQATLRAFAGAARIDLTPINFGPGATTMLALRQLDISERTR